jgi:hypothetical protein
MNPIDLQPATADEQAAFYTATTLSGVELWHTDIVEILDLPLCKQQQKLQPSRTDAAYLVAANTVPRTVQWYARHADGRRRPFGLVMTVLNDPKVK